MPVPAERAVSVRRLSRAFRRRYQEYRERGQASNVAALLRRLPALSETEVRGFQNVRLSFILRYAATHTEYFRPLIDRKAAETDPFGTLSRLPTLTKATIRSQSALLTSDWLSKLPHYVQNTGGSTGDPLEFLRTALSSKIVDVHQRHALECLGYREGDRVIGLGGSRLSSEALAVGRFWESATEWADIPFGSVRFSSLKLTPSTAEQYLAQMRSMKPALLVAYPSAADLLARAALEHPENQRLRLKGVQLTSETVTKGQIERISGAFGCAVQLQYGHSEAAVCGIAAAPDYRYLCSPFFGVTEVLDEGGRQVAVGEPGEVVVTGFYNLVMPFIRYRTGDLALAGGVEKGQVVLRELMGRQQDFLVGRRGQRVSVTALIFGQHLEVMRHVVRFQLEQTRPGEVLVRLEREPGYAKEHEKALQEHLSQVGDVASSFDYSGSFIMTPRGKCPFVIHQDGDGGASSASIVA